MRLDARPSIRRLSCKLRALARDPLQGVIVIGNIAREGPNG
jgi:hypothetical protein